MNQIRIIGGKYRGKLIRFPSIAGLRPTPAIVRETLFNWLMYDVHHAYCLDAFAGSGALGFEALSRGAMHVTFIEKNLTAFKALQKTSQRFENRTCNILLKDSLAWLATTKSQFHIIFLDPPFESIEVLEKALASIEKRNLLLSGGLLYIETPNLFHLNADIWEQLKIKKTGQVCSQLLKKHN